MITSGPCQMRMCTCKIGSFSTLEGPVAHPVCLGCRHPFYRHLALSYVSQPLISAPIVKPSWCPRPVVVSRLFQRMLDHRVVVVRGTPACGKSVLMQLLHRHILEQRPAWKVNIFNHWPANLNDQQSIQYLQGSTGMSEDELLSAQDRVVCIDDAQTSYYDVALWSLLKLCEPRIGTYFVLFTAYSNPGHFPMQMLLGAPPLFRPQQLVSMTWENCKEGDTPLGLLLSHDEAKDVIDRACQYDKNNYIISNELGELLIEMSGGHVGALSGLIETINSDRAIRINGIGESMVIDVPRFGDAFFDTPTASRLQGTLSREGFSRGLPNREDVAEETVAHVLKKMAHGSKMGQKQFNAIFQGEDFSKYEIALVNCHKKGWIHKELLDPAGDLGEEAYVFPSPLHHWYSRSLLLLNPPTQQTSAFRSPLEMAITIIKGFKSSKLSDLGRSNTERTPIGQAQYGKEWYRSADLVLDGNFLWSPVIGELGSIDFYLAGCKWGFQLVREGKDLAAHNKCFLPDGSYHRWILNGSMVEYLLLDFCVNNSSTQHPEIANLFHVCFGDDFTDVAILDNQLRRVAEFRLSDEEEV